jgi:LysR family transcriptional regulator, glycine cleavage system transcriptional activator
VRAGLDRIASATARVRGGARHGPLAICAYPTFAMRWLMPRWRQFHDRHPEIDVQLTTSLAPVDFNRDGFDAAVRMGEGGWPGLGAIKLAEVETFPVCSPRLFKGRKPDLARARLIHSAPRPQDWPRWLEAAKLGGANARPGLTFESLNLAFQAAIEGMGIAIGIGCLVADDLAQRRLVRPFKPVRRSRRAFWLVYPQGRAGDPRLAALLGWLHDLGR